MPFTPTTWNPSDKSTKISLSSGDSTISQSTNGYSIARSVHSVTSGKWLVSIERNTGNAMVGVASATEALDNYLGQSSQSMGLFGNTMYPSATSYGLGNDPAGKLGIALDADSRTLEIFGQVGSTGSLAIPFSGPIFLAAGSGSNVSSAFSITLRATSTQFYAKAGFYNGFGLRTMQTLSGVITGASGAPVARLVYAYREDTGALMGSTTSNATTGAYSILTEYSGTHTLVFYPLAGETTLPALVRRGVTPV